MAICGREDSKWCAEASSTKYESSRIFAEEDLSFDARQQRALRASCLPGAPRHRQLTINLACKYI